MINIDICPYCGGTVSLVDSDVVYGKSYGLIYLCDNYPKCDAYVGVHSNSKRRHAPLGRLANAELRRLKKEAHRWLDPLWRYKFRTTKDHDAKKNAYKWLAQKLGMKISGCHIGMFNEEECTRVIDICRVIYYNKPQLEKFRNELIKKGEV